MKEILITSGVLILVITAARLIFRGKVSQQFLYGAWLLVAIRLLIPIQFGQFDFSVLNRTEPVTEAITEVSRNPISGPSRQEIYQQVSQDFSDLGYDIETPEIQVQIEQTVTESITVPTVGEIATTVWIAGMIGMAVWFSVVNVLYARKLRHGSVVVEEGHIPVRVSGAISSPCLFGLFRPVIYLTPACMENEQMRRHVLTHELTHRKHWDHIWSLVRCVCLCIYWFNPLVWLAAFLSRRDCELACDEAALKHLGDSERIAYGRTLVDMVAISASPNHLLQTATTMHESKKQLKERVNYIVKKPKVFITAVLCMLLILGITAGCAFAGAKQANPTDPQPSEPTAPSASAPTTGATEEATQGSDPAPDVMALFPDIPAVTELTETPANPTTANMVTSVYDIGVEWSNGTDDMNKISIELPALTPISDDAIAINERIRNIFGYQIGQMRLDYEYGHSSYNRHIYYEANQNEDIVSILIVICGDASQVQYIAYSLNIATGQEIYTADFAREYYDMSYPEFLHCSTMIARNLFKDTFPDSYFAQFDFDVLGMDSHTLFLGENGQMMLSSAQHIGAYDSFRVPFDATVAGPASTQREKEAYHWLFHLKTDGAMADTHSTLLANAFLADADEFVRYLTNEKLGFADYKQVEDIVSLTASGLSKNSYPMIQSICKQLLQQDPSEISAWYIWVVNEILETASAKEDKDAIKKETLQKIIATRTVLPESEYTWTVTCTPAINDHVWGAQSNVTTYVRDSSFSHILARDVDHSYSDALCPISAEELADKYDEAFFKDHVLVIILVLSEEGKIPAVRKVDYGESLYDPTQFGGVNIYLENTAWPISAAGQVYQIFLELPLSCTTYILEDYDYLGIEEGWSYWDIACGE